MSFGGVNLSTYGFALTGMAARAMAPFKAEEVPLLRSMRHGELPGEFEDSTTALRGTLSSDTVNRTFYTHSELNLRLHALKSAINPLKGYQKLVITGDETNYWRWARFSSMSYDESRPIFKKPFNELDITFDNLEPFWRVAATPVTVTSVPTAIPNVGDADSRPVIELTASGTINATAAAEVQPVTLFTIDNFQVTWSDLTSTFGSGDKVIVDSETLTCRILQSSVPPELDAIRYYGFGGPDSFATDGFPVIKAAGSSVSQKHSLISSIVFTYDLLYA